MAGYAGRSLRRSSLCTMSGELQLIMGPMFSGKSSELLRRARRYQFARKSVVVLK